MTIRVFEEFFGDEYVGEHQCALLVDAVDELEKKVSESKEGSGGFRDASEEFALQINRHLFYLMHGGIGQLGLSRVTKSQ